MSKICAIASLLFACTGSMAFAGEHPDQIEKQSKGVKKALIMLGAMGLDSPEVLRIVDYVDKNTDDGYLKLAEEQTMGGTLKLHYELSNGAGIKQLELRFTPDDSDFYYTVRTNTAMMNYSYKF